VGRRVLHAGPALQLLVLLWQPCSHLHKRACAEQRKLTLCSESLFFVGSIVLAG
jgi:hypothetical protein